MAAAGGIGINDLDKVLGYSQRKPNVLLLKFQICPPPKTSDQAWMTALDRAKDLPFEAVFRDWSLKQPALGNHLFRAYRGQIEKFWPLVYMRYRWLDENRHVTLIPCDDLQGEDVPPVDSDWSEIVHFAHTFNAYDHWGSFEKCAEIANAKRHDTLEDLRTCLFFEARRWRHFGEDPDETAKKVAAGRRG